MREQPRDSSPDPAAISHSRGRIWDRFQSPARLRPLAVGVVAFESLLVRHTLTLSHRSRVAHRGLLGLHPGGRR